MGYLIMVFRNGLQDHVLTFEGNRKRLEAIMANTERTMGDCGYELEAYDLTYEFAE